MFKKIKINKILLGIFLLALLLRLFGIWHGWPFIYNVDEPALVRSAVGIRFNPNPAHFDWPHLHFYLSFGVLAFLYLVRGFFQVVGLQPFLVQVIPFFWKDPAVYYLVVRIFNAFLGALTVIPVYLTGRVLFGAAEGKSQALRLFRKPGSEESAADGEERKSPKGTSLGCFLSTQAWRNLGFGNLAAILSALAFAVIPLHVKNSHLATIDVPMVFWLTWSMYFAARILRSSNWKNYLLAGVFAGLAASTKYNGIIILLVVALAHLLRFFLGKQSEGNNPGLAKLNPGLGEFGLSIYQTVTSPKLILSGLIALLVFFLGTPYALLDWETFWSSEYIRGVLWQFENIGGVSSWAEYFSNFKRLAWTDYLPVNFSWPFYIILLFTIGEFVYLVLSVIQRRSADEESPAVTKRAVNDRGFFAQLRFAQNDSRELAFLLIFPIFYCLFVIRGKKFGSHYFLPAYPFVALIVGRFIAKIARFVSYLWDLAEVPSTKSQNPNKSQISKRQIKNRGSEGKEPGSEADFRTWFWGVRRRVGTWDFLARRSLGGGGAFGISARSVLFALILFVFAVPLYRSFGVGLVYSRADTRTQASQWVDENVEEGSLVAVSGEKSIEIIAQGVEVNHFKKLSVVDKFEEYDFIIVAKEKPEYMLEKMADNYFELVQEYPNTDPTRHGPHVWVFQNMQE